MQYLNKLLNGIKSDPAIFKSPEIVVILGLTQTQIKNLKKYALEKEFIIQNKLMYYLTDQGEKYLQENPLYSWANAEFPERPEVNVEYLKEDSATPSLTKAMRNYAKFLLEEQPLNELSLEYALVKDVEKSEKIRALVEIDILSGKRKSLVEIYDKYQRLGLTKSLISIIVLKNLVSNIEKIAIYEKGLFQLKFDKLMFDRMMVCPQNFEIQKTEMSDQYLIKDISKIILNKKSDNIIEITKGLYSIIKKLDKYSMNTQSLNQKTLRLRNTIVNAKDPIALFERDIPMVLAGKKLQECDREFLDSLKKSLNELKSSTENLILEIKKFVFKSFNAKSKEELSERFLAIKEFIGEKELKVLFNTVIDVNIPEELWLNRIATLINKLRVPKDWSDEDFADFKLKSKELSLKFLAIEATVGFTDSFISKSYKTVLKSFLNLSKNEQMVLLRHITTKI